MMSTSRRTQQARMRSFRRHVQEFAGIWVPELYEASAALVRRFPPPTAKHDRSSQEQARSLVVAGYSNEVVFRLKASARMVKHGYLEHGHMPLKSSCVCSTHMTLGHAPFLRERGGLSKHSNKPIVKPYHKRKIPH